MLSVSNTIFSSQAALNGVWRDINDWFNLSLHITGLEGNVWCEVSNDPNVLTNGAVISAPASPILTQYTPTTDSHISGIPVTTTYYVKNTYVTPNTAIDNMANWSVSNGETTASVEASLTVLAGNLLVVQSPAKDAGGYATGWNTYIDTQSGAETLQNLKENSVVNSLQFGQTFILKNGIKGQIVPPTTNTSSSPNSGVNLTGNLAAASYNEGALNQIQVIISGTQAMINPSGVAWKYIRVCKDSTANTVVTTGFLFGQVG
jgi:hypothetical protein